MDLSFNGTRYHGWQSQPGVPTIQSAIGQAMEQILHKNMSVTGAGRTDAGVHTRHFMAHFELEEEMNLNTEELAFSLNALLPQDIVIHRIFRVDSQMHARFTALSRTYEYNISREKDPFGQLFSWYFYGNLDLEKMNRATQLLKGTKDFTSFSKLHTQTATNICTVFDAFWKQEEHNLVFVVRADRFLRNMVRAMVGTLIKVGTGKIKPDEITAIIQAKDRSLAGPSAPACGLTLIQIEYPEGTV